MSTELVEPPPACPGLDSDLAGKQTACQGCPNQTACSSGTAKSSSSDEDAYAISRRMRGVKRIVLVLSGKGGVGKSTVATCMARALALDPLCSVGLLDVDICGPSVPTTTGLLGEDIHMSSSGWSPVYLQVRIYCYVRYFARTSFSFFLLLILQENLAVMSCGFLLDSPDSSVVWRGPKKNGLIKQFLRDVDWGELDYLVVDTPPGTSDEHLSLVSLLKHCDSFTGALIVTTPQEVALADVRKQVDFCNKVKLRVLGFVKNMSGFVCPKCDVKSDIFKQTDGLQQLSASSGIPVLAEIPLDPKIAKACDEGQSCFEEHSDAVAVIAFKLAVAALVKRISDGEVDNEKITPS